MTLTHCPNCKEELSRIEQLDGRCVSCGKDFEKASSVTHGEPDESPYHPTATGEDPLTLRQKESVGLLILFLLTSPLLIYSCYVGLQKGDTMCAAAGCSEDATKHVDYSGGIKRGYCSSHEKEAPSTFSGKQGKMPYVLCILAVLFIIHYFMAFKESYTGRTDPPKDPARKPRNPFRYFLWLTIAGVIGVNAVFWFASRYMC